MVSSSEFPAAIPSFVTWAESNNPGTAGASSLSSEEEPEEEDEDRDDRDGEPDELLPPIVIFFPLTAVPSWVTCAPNESAGKETLGPFSSSEDEDDPEADEEFEPERERDEEDELD